MFLKSSILAAAVLILLLSAASHSQFIVDVESRESTGNLKILRERGVEILDEIQEVLKLKYYDKNYRGMDVDKRFKIAKDKVRTLETHSQVFRTIAQLVLEFNDSHTMFYPPGRAHRLEYGFTMQAIGNEVVVTSVKKASDAEAKGVRVGDVVKKIGIHNLSRQNLKLINYFIYYLEPQERLRLLVEGADKKDREVIVIPTMKTLEERLKEQKEERQKKEKRAEAPYKCREVNPETIACRLETFLTATKYVDKMMTEARPYKKLILDLRGNRGGYLKTEEYLTGYFFDQKVKIADMVTRFSKKERYAKSRGDKAFSGELMVLVDSRSASASELFSRVIQIEKRGKIVGDVTSGAVMASNSIQMAQTHNTTYVFYVLSVTVADLIMSDGGRLEDRGVIPDYPVGPTRDALYSGADPVLSYAASLLGAKLSSADAGKFYFLTKAPEVDDDENADDDSDSDSDKLE